MTDSMIVQSINGPESVIYHLQSLFITTHLSTEKSFSFCLSDDRHRVKLHSLLADPSSDYVNANYIDVSPLRLSLASFSSIPLCWPHSASGAQTDGDLWLWLTRERLLVLTRAKLPFSIYGHNVASYTYSLYILAHEVRCYHSSSRDPTRAHKLGAQGTVTPQNSSVRRHWKGIEPTDPFHLLSDVLISLTVQLQWASRAAS